MVPNIAVFPIFHTGSLRRFDVARSPALAESSKFVGLLTLKRPEGRAPTSRQLVDAQRRTCPREHHAVGPAN